MKRSIYIILILAFFSGACEKIIDISVQDKSRKIVMNAILNPDSIVSVQLSQSKSILEDNIVLFLKDAAVEAFEDDELMGSLEYRGFGRYILPGMYPKKNKSYRFEVAYPSLASVYSEISIPEIVAVLGIDTSRSFNDWGNPVFNLDVRIDDPSDTENYYAMSIAVTSRIFDWQTEEYSDSTETYMTYFNPTGIGDSDIGGDFVDQDLTFFVDDKMFFSDALFDGNSTELELSVEYYIYTHMSDSVMIDIRVDHIDPSYYFYSVSKQKYYQTDGNPFAEPVQVYNNIENGFGILSAYSRTSKNYSMFVSGEK